MFEKVEVDGRTILVKGVGKMFYQEGFPISMAIEELRKKDIEVSILHVADECMKHGWSSKTTFNKIKGDFMSNVDDFNDWDLLERFCYAEYEDQREMIFQYLFGCTTNDVISGENTKPLEIIKEIL